MITWLKINFGQWRDHVDPPNKFLRCHVSTFLTGQNKDKKSLTLDSLQAQNYQLLGPQGVSKVRSDILSAFISEITQTTFSKIKYVVPYSFYVE